MELIYSGLKCDHCSYRDDTVPFSDYEKSIGRPCPACGNSLLTREDYEECLLHYRIIARLNRIGGVLKWLNPFYYVRLMLGDPDWMKFDYEHRFKNKHNG